LAGVAANVFIFSLQTPSMQRFDLAAVPPSPWKNGGGHTRELACWPPGAGMDRFEWRVSVATIAASGPFSAFAGVDRQIMLLDGDGVQLTAHNGSLHHSLDQRWQPLHFSGDVALDCTLLGGTSTDFNLMLRRGCWQGDVEVISDVQRPGCTAAGLCLVLAGQWRWGEALLTAGQGLWWSAAQADAAALRPMEDAVDAPVLAWVGLEPVQPGI
jgi:environmental stress-induced protein Ves